MTEHVTLDCRSICRDSILLAALSYVCFVNTFTNPFIDYDDEWGGN